MNKYYVYMMSNISNTVLYTGVTNDLERRIVEHRTPDEKSFTTRYNCHKLVYFEEFSSIVEAISREKQIKSWNRKRKNLLVDRANPNWIDLMQC